MSKQQKELFRKNRPHGYYFKLYKEASADLRKCESARGTTFGIAARPVEQGDYWAERWQQIRMRVEILDAYLEGRKPNWYYCSYLPNEEKERRNKSYQNPDLLQPSTITTQTPHHMRQALIALIALVLASCEERQTEGAETGMTETAVITEK